MLEINKFTNHILKDISFSLKEEEHLIILGANGAGKSTLAKVLSTLISNDKVKLFNEEVNSLSDEKRARFINYIPPKLEIFDEYITLYEFLELSFIEKINRKKLEEIISLLKLEKIKNRACNDLSSGEKQLLLLASSIIHNAKITIFDELTANMDITRVQEAFLIFNSKYLQQKIIITHNLDLAFHLKYKILYLEEGEVKFFGQSKEFFSKEILSKFYQNCLKVVDGHLVVKL
ncbi:ABC transporter ATP-binding protein [Halarcobacter bivalviorum]|uniref:Iron ABC transporter ATP-binding protein n=1 Tax=Halarcobacter bivalviorum TaxID=663364 RepID=A0AAX2AC40_9BACT|nr:ABC transporter ATP-binding protein [Halarcobacter bivalviorum]AXH12431.1 iron siderophore ABC transporter, ATP-binding protein [Halarcobacter bivalviorum]RXK10643.1 iron ABC transporter ATP-binding protein [Halarcobacter bivalviorum]